MKSDHQANRYGEKNEREWSSVHKKVSLAFPKKYIQDDLLDEDYAISATRFNPTDIDITVSRVESFFPEDLIKIANEIHISLVQYESYWRVKIHLAKLNSDRHIIGIYKWLEIDKYEIRRFFSQEIDVADNETQFLTMFWD